MLFRISVFSSTVSICIFWLKYLQSDAFMVYSTSLKQSACYKGAVKEPYFLVILLFLEQ